jgi:hypothetical protein
MKPSRWRGWLANTILFLVASVLSLGLFLLALPHVLPEPIPMSGLPDYDVLVAFDPDRPGGHLLPDRDLLVQGERAGQGVRWRTDRHGFRIEGELTPQPAPGVERVFLLGDSYIDGMRTDQSQTIGALLAKALDARGHAAEVVISAHNNPANAWYWLQAHSAAFAPQHVVLGITLGNDLVFQNLGVGVVPGPSAGEALLLRRDRLDGDPFRVPGLLPADAFTPPSAWGDAWDARMLAARDGLARRLDFFAQRVPPATGPFKHAPRKVYERDFFTSINLFFTPATLFTEESFQRSETTLAGIGALLRARGVEFTVVLLPTRFQVDRRDWDLLKQRLALNGQRFDLRAPNRRLLAFCTKKALRCLDPSDRMQAHIRKTGARLYRPLGDMHLNEAGNAVIAEWLAAEWPMRER